MQALNKPGDIVFSKNTYCVVMPNSGELGFLKVEKVSGKYKLQSIILGSLENYENTGITLPPAQLIDMIQTYLSGFIGTETDKAFRKWFADDYLRKLEELSRQSNDLGSLK